MNISSSAFKDGENIPAKYTCDGEDISPPLSISDVPEDALSLAIIIDDPDAPSGDFVHWIMWNIDPKTTEIQEGAVPEGAIQGLTDFNLSEYGGPCPPSGVHNYHIWVYALDTKMSLSSTAQKVDLESEMNGCVLAQAHMVGRYQKA